MIKQLKRVGAMRDVIALASDPTVDKVSGFNFRSEEEVQKFLDLLNDGIGTIQQHLKGMNKLFSSAVTAAGGFSIDRNSDAPAGPNKGPAMNKGMDGLPNVGKIKIANPQKLKDSYALVNELSNKLDILDTLEQQVMHNFRGDRATKLPIEIKKTRTAYEKQLNAAMVILKKIAKEHEPKKFAQLVEGISNYFHDGFQNKFTKAESHLFVTNQDFKGTDGEKHPHLVFNHYLQFTNLQNDHLEYVFPTYIIAYTAVVNAAGGMRMYVTSQHKFRAPGTFKLGHEFKDMKSGVHALSAQFESDDFIDMLDRQPIPVTEDQIDLHKFASKEFIKDKKIANHTLTFMFNSKVNIKNVLQVAGKVGADVRALLSGKVKANLRTKIIDKTKGIEFIVTLPSNVNTQKFLTAEKIDRLKEDLDFDDRDIGKLMQLFNNGHTDNAAPYDRPRDAGPEAIPEAPAVTRPQEEPLRTRWGSGR